MSLGRQDVPGEQDRPHDARALAVAAYRLAPTAEARAVVQIALPVANSSASTEYSSCCIVLSVEMLTHGQVLARFGHALSDPVRARLLLALREAPGYPADLADLLGTSRQNLSNHLACLRGCGLVASVPQGRRTRYELADPRVAHALGDLLGLVLSVDPAACPSAETDGCC